MSNDDLEFKIKATDAATSVLKQVRSEIAKVGDTVKGMSGQISSGFNFAKMLTALPIVGQAAGMVAEFAQECIKAFEDQERAAKHLDRVLESTGNTTKLTADQIKEFASARQNLTTFDDDVTIEAASQLARFKGIQGQFFKDSIVAAQDMATVLGMDLSSASQLLGKALSDPAEGMTKLKRAGVLLGEEKENLVKYFQKTGDAASAQSVILKELERQFKGAADAESDTLGGKLAQFNNTIGELKEAIGKQLAPAAESLLEFLNEEGGTAASVTKAKLAGERQITGTGNDRLDSYDKTIKEMTAARDALYEDAKKAHKKAQEITLLGTLHHEGRAEEFYKQGGDIQKKINAVKAERERELGKIQVDEAIKQKGIKEDQAKTAAKEAKDKLEKEQQQQWNRFQESLATQDEKNKSQLEDFDKLKGTVNDKDFQEYRQRLVDSFSKSSREEAARVQKEKEREAEKARVRGIEEQINSVDERRRGIEDQIKGAYGRDDKLSATGGRLITTGSGNLNDSVRKNEREQLQNLKSMATTLLEIKRELQKKKDGLDVKVVNLH